MDLSILSDYLILNHDALGIALLVFTGLAVLLMFLVPVLARRNYCAFPLLDPAPAGFTPPDHAVIIPARDEAPNIQRAVRSFPHSLVLVIDDASTDETARLAAEAGAEVRPAEPAPPSWLGKPNACWNGACYTESDYVAFSDADFHPDPAFLDAVLAHATALKLHAVTILPPLEPQSTVEKILLPYLDALRLLGRDADAIHTPTNPASYANGRFTLFLRSAYQFLGGHRAVSTFLTDDQAFAELLKRHRMGLSVLRAEGLAHGDRSDAPREVVRNFTAELFQWPLRTLGILSAAALNALWLPLVFLLLWFGYWIAAIIILPVPVLAWMNWYGGPRQALYAPLAIYYYLALAATGVALRLLPKRVLWKGRRV